MLSHEYRCVFVHIPKTAGQSIEQFFLNLHKLTWSQTDRDRLLMRKNQDPAKGPSRLAHMTAEEYYQCGHISEQTFNNYFSFAFVRNPWARLVSEYLHKKIDKEMSLKEFVLEGLPHPDPLCDKHRHIIPQSDFIFDDRGNQIVDFVGRFENLQRDFDHVCRQLGLEDSTLPHRNSSYSPRRLLLRKIRHLFNSQQRVKKHYTEYYDEELFEIVADMYAEDIKRFNYQFEAPGFYDQKAIA